MEIVLLLIVAACVIALICITKKFKDLEEGFSASSYTHSTSSAKGSFTSVHRDEEAPSDPTQNTIYEFIAESRKCLCPWCDGENSVGAKVCNICGRDI